MRRLSIWCRAAAFGLACLLAATASLPARAQDEGTQAAAPQPVRVGPKDGMVRLDGRVRYFLDESGRMSVDELEVRGESLPWRVREPGQQHRIDGAALWLQFDAELPAGSRWYLVLSNSGLDRVQLFHRNMEQGWKVQEAGDSRPVSQWPLPGRVPTLELDGPNAGMVRYWVRVEHQRSDFAVPVMLYSQAALVAARESEQFLLGGYFAVALLLVLVSVANAVALRDRNFAAFALYLLVFCSGQVAYLGVGAQHLWDDWLRWNEVASFLLPGLTAAAGLWFAKVVTEPARFSRALDLAVWSLIAAMLSAVALDTFLGSRASFALVMVLSGAALAVIVGLVLLAWRRGGDAYVHLIALGFLPVLVTALFPIARGLNVLPNSLLTRYGLVLGAAVQMPVLFYALTLRARRRRDATRRAAQLPHTDALTGLDTREALLQRLHDALQRAHQQRHRCALLAIRLSNLEALASEYGREAADRALVVAASVLRAAASDIDLPARVGPQDFALLLDGPTAPEAALGRAQQVVARGLQHAPGLPPTASLKFHVALAQLPDGERDAARCLLWLEEACTAMRADPRRAIRPLNF